MKLRARLILTLASVMAIPTAVAQGAPDLDVGRQVYERSCAACHGAAGRPDPANPVVRALDPPPADLSDPLFNSREPAADWVLVVAHGGAALGLSAAMPAQSAALSERDIENVVAYIKTLAPGSERYPPGELNLMLPIRTRKAFPEDEVVFKSRWTERSGEDAYRAVVEFEKRVGARGQAIVEVVYSDAGSEQGIDEIELGYKHTLGFSLAGRWLTAGGVILAIPDDSEDSEELVPFVAYASELRSGNTLQGSVRAKLPVDDLDSGELEIAAAFHRVLTDWPRRVFPALELIAEIPFDPAPGEDPVKLSALPQVRIGLTRGGHVALNLGVELPLSDQDYDWRGHAVLLWDFADGSLFKGW